VSSRLIYDIARAPGRPHFNMANWPSNSDRFRSCLEAAKSCPGRQYYLQRFAEVGDRENEQVEGIQVGDRPSENLDEPRLETNTSNKSSGSQSDDKSDKFEELVASAIKRRDDRKAQSLAKPPALAQPGDSRSDRNSPALAQPGDSSSDRNAQPSVNSPALAPASPAVDRKAQIAAPYTRASSSRTIEMREVIASRERRRSKSGRDKESRESRRSKSGRDKESRESRRSKSGRDKRAAVLQTARVITAASQSKPLTIPEAAVYWPDPRDPCDTINSRSMIACRIRTREAHNARVERLERERQGPPNMPRRRSRSRTPLARRRPNKTNTTGHTPQ